jgi:hypothetical protein
MGSWTKKQELELMIEAQRKLSLATRLPNNIVFGALTNGGSPAMNVNGSVTPVQFRYTATEPIVITRITGIMMDAAIAPELFGGLPELTNGMEVHFHDDKDNIILDPTFGQPIKANWQFSLFSVTAPQITAGAAVEDLFEFGVVFGQQKMGVLFPTGYYIDFTIQDDLTGLTKFQATVAGYKLAIDQPLKQYEG